MKIQLLTALLFIGLVSLSCSDKTATPKSIKFTTTQATYSESTGTVTIPVTISEKETSDVKVYYSWTSPTDTTYLGGDFTIDNIGSVTIPAGQTSVEISMQIIDDTQIDGQDDIKFTLTSSTGGNAKPSPTASEITTEILINDNDTAPADQLQIDLTWHLKDRTANINAVDLDLAALYGVVISGGSVTNQGTPLSYSANSTGFETAFIDAAADDQDYYMGIGYAVGTSDLIFTVTMHGLGYAGRGTGDFASTDANYITFFGPFTKTGTSISYTGGRREVEFILNNLGKFKKK